MTNFMPCFYHTCTSQNLPGHGHFEEQHHIIPQAPWPTACSQQYVWIQSCIYGARGKLLPSLFFIYHNSGFYFIFLNKHGTMFKKSSLSRAWTLEQKLPGSKWQLCYWAMWQAVICERRNSSPLQPKCDAQEKLELARTQVNRPHMPADTNYTCFSLHRRPDRDESRNISVEKKAQQSI